MTTLPLPVLLVTGFLGSGKTTCLRRIAENYPQRRMVFLVNEFAQQSVDGDNLLSTRTPTHSVVGGSLFCHCKAGEFVRVLKEQILPVHDREPLDALIIETSGIADPEAIGTLLEQHELADALQIISILAIVSPKNLQGLLKNLPVAASQIQTSDVIILNKTDLCTPEQIESAKVLIRELNPQARQIQSEYCRFDYNIFEGTATIPQGELSTRESNPFTTRILKINTPSDNLVFDKWIHELPQAILRVKGFLKMNDGKFYHVEKTVDHVNLELISENTSAQMNQLVLIAHDDHAAILDAVAAP